MIRFSTSDKLKYDRGKNMDCSKALDYYKQNDNEFGPLINGKLDKENTIKTVIGVNTLYVRNMDRKFVGDLLFIGQHCPSFEVRTVFQKWSTFIQQEIDTIVQIEYMNRNMLPEWTKNDISLIIETLNKFPNQPSFLTGLKNREIMFGGALVEFIWKILSRLGMKNIIKMHVHPSFAVTAVLLAQLGIRAGLPADSLNIIPVEERHFDGTWDITRNHENLFRKFNYGCTFTIFEESDLDSALDVLIDGAASHQGILPWNVKNILIKESIYESFVQKLKQKSCNEVLSLNFKQMENTKSDLNNMNRIIEEAKKEGCSVITLPKYEIGKIAPPTFLLENISQNLLQNIQKHNNLPFVYVQTFRTIKEAKNLLKLQNRVAISIWCNNSAVNSDIMFSVKSFFVWVNSYGVISPMHLAVTDYFEYYSCEGLEPSQPAQVNKEVKTWNSSSTYDDCLQKCMQMKIQWNNLSELEKLTIFQNSHSYLQDWMNKHKKDLNEISALHDFTSSILHYFSNAKTILKIFKDELNVKDQAATMMRYEPVGVVATDSLGCPFDLAYFLMMAISIGNGVILSTHMEILGQLCLNLQQQGLPIIAINLSAYDRKDNRVKIFKLSDIEFDRNELLDNLCIRKFIYTSFGNAHVD